MFFYISMLKSTPILMEMLFNTDFNKSTSCYPALNIILEKVGHFFKGNRAPGNDIQCGRLEISGQP